VNLLLGASLLVSFLTGWLLVCIFLPPGEYGREHGAGGFALKLFAGAGIGIGFTSCVHFACLLAGLTPYAAAVDIAVCLILGLLCFMLSKKRRLREAALAEERHAALPPSQGIEAGRAYSHTLAGGKKGGRGNSGVRQGLRAAPLILVSLFAIEAAASLISFFVAFLKEPHGRWDAWLIWNMHARFLFRAGEGWREVFASGMDWSHWDYPLLLPLAIVRSWGYMGGEGGNVPAAFAFVFAFLVAGLLLSSLSLLKGGAEGILATMVLLGTPFFIMMGASQFADVPFAFFILLAIVMFFLQSRAPESHAGPTITAGLAAGLCAWTKNEGLLFLPVAMAATALVSLYTEGWKHSIKRTVWFSLGALPAVLCVLYFKLSLSPVNDLIAGFSPAAAGAKLLDWERYAEIAEAFLITGISFTQGLIDIRVGMKLNPGAVNILLLTGYLLLGGIRIGEKERPAFF